MLDEEDEGFDREELAHESDEIVLNNAGVTLGVFGDNTWQARWLSNEQANDNVRRLQSRDNFCE